MEQYGDPANTLSDPREPGFEHRRSPVKAIRAHCVECMGGSCHDVRDCSSPGCHLYPFRMGTNIFHSRATAQNRLEGGPGPGFSTLDET